METYDPDQLYTWLQHRDTEEWHLFKSKNFVDRKTFTKNCHIDAIESMCSLMKANEVAFELKEKCVKEDRARMQAAEILKRDACGRCVSTLYSTPAYKKTKPRTK